MSDGRTTFRRADGSIFMIADRELDLQALIAAPMPPVPPDVSFEGVSHIPACQTD